jgi:polyisoprenyl-teichoic acid--peptidoglycan teichoic acid transferase
MWARWCIFLGVLLVLISGVFVAGTKLVAAIANHQVDNQNLLGPAGAQGQAPEHHVTIKGAKNILLIGLDTRPAQSPYDAIRADSIIILHIPADHQSAYLVSIPRDTYVHIPAYKHTGWGGGYDKINAAYAYGQRHDGGTAGGVQLLAKTIESLGGPAPDAAAVIEFTGFKQVVDALNGVYMCVDETTTSIHTGFTVNGHKEAAPYHVNSDGTVGYRIPGVVPMKYPKGLDYGRQRHQQQFLKAVFKKLFSAGTLANPIRLNRVLEALNKAMTIDKGGIEPTDWIYAMRGLTPDNLITVKTNGGQLNPKTIDGLSYELLSEDSLKLLGALKRDTVDNFLSQHQDWVSASPS